MEAYFLLKLIKVLTVRVIYVKELFAKLIYFILQLQVDCELEKSTIILGNKEKSIVLIKNEKSVYASLAYLFEDSIHTKTALSSAADELHKKAFSFIRNNMDLFINRVSEIYGQTLPKTYEYKLNHMAAFKYCCDYLAAANNYRFYEPIRAIATIYRTPVIVTYEDGRKSDRIEPLITPAYPPKEIGCRGNLYYVPVIPSDLLLGTWNLIGSNVLISSEKFKMIDECLEKHKVDVVCLQCCVTSNSTFCGMSTDNYFWYCSVVTKNNSGVAFLVRKKSSVTLSSFTSHLCNLISADLTLQNECYRIIGVNFSDSATDKQLSAVLPEVISQAPPSSQVVLLGEFNAMIGSSSLNKDVKLLIGTDLHHKYCNKNGTLLKNLAVYYNLKIVTTFPNEKALPDCTLKESALGADAGSHILVDHKPGQLCKRFLWREEKVSSRAILASVLTSPPVDRDCEILEDFRVATWRAGDCSLATHRKTVDRTLKQWNVDFICIQETKMGVQGVLSTENYDWWCSGETPSPLNIAFLLRKGCGATLTDFKTLSRSVVSAIVTVGWSQYAVIGCHLPPCSSDQYHRTTLNLMLALNQAPLSAKLLLLGDFSAFLSPSGQRFSAPTRQSTTPTGSKAVGNNVAFMNRLIDQYDFFICSDYSQLPEIATEAQSSHIFLHRGNKLNRKGEAKNYNVQSYKQGFLVTYNLPKEHFYVG